MDENTALEKERADLAKADRDIQEGQDRIDRQSDIVRHLASQGRDTREAERLLTLLQQSLEIWQAHRLLIRQRIRHLEQPCWLPGIGPDILRHQP